jgi:hypothetical protein
MKRVPLYSRSHRPTETPAEPAAAATDAGPAPKPGRWAALARHERRLWALLILCLGVAFWWSNPTFRAKPPLTIEQIDAAIRQSIEDKPLVAPESRAYDAIIPSVVRVVGLMTEGDDGSDNKENGTVERGVGTGVVIIDNGTILTNLHVVSGAKKVRVTFFDGSESDAMVLSTQPENDLAVLRAKTIPDDLEAATMRSTADLASGRPRPGGRLPVRHRPVGVGRRRLGPEAPVPLARRPADAHQPDPVRRRRQPGQLGRPAGDDGRRGGRHRHRDPEPEPPARLHRHRLRRADRERGRGGGNAAVLDTRSA